MKFIVRTRALIVVLSVFLSTSVFAQLSGGMITTSSICAPVGSPASDLTNVSAASGGVSPYNYQWEAKIEYSNWTNVVNVGNSLNLSPGVLYFTTTYRRKVTDGAGNSAYSNEVKILKTELNAGSIGFSSGSSPFVVGSTVSIGSGPGIAGSGSYAYGWEVSNSASGPWSPIAGETGLIYQFTFNGLGTWYYRKKVTDLNCGGVVYSNILKVEIVATALFNPQFWGTTHLCVLPGSTPSLLQGALPLGGTPPYSYQWEQKAPSDISWQNIGGATSQNYQPPVLASATMFRRKTSDAAGNTGYTNEETINVVNSAANPGSIALNTTNIAPNAPYIAAIEIASASNFYNGQYVWEVAYNGGSWSEISGYSYNNYYPETPPTSTTCYRRAIREVCAGGNKDTWTSFVCYYPALPLTAGSISVSGGNSACVTPSTTSGIITGTAATGGSAPYTYKWQKFIDPDWTDIAGTNTVSYNPGVINHDIKYRRLVSDGSGTTLYSNEVTVTVKSLTSLKGGIIDGPIVTCSNTAPGIINNILDACGGGGTFTYTWEISTNGGSWSPVSGSNQATYNASAINADTKYRRKVADGCGGEVYSNEVSVYVYPSIEAGTITPSTQSVCTNQTPEILGLAQNCHYTNGNVTYQWQKSLSPSGPWTNVNGATNSYLLPKVSTVSSYYRLVVRSSVCNAEAISNVSSVIVNNCTVRTTGGTDAGNLIAANYSGKGNIKVYPNPIAKGQIVFVTFDGEGAGSKATLRGTDGRAYSCTIVAGNRGSLQVKLPNGVAQGTYILQINNGAKQWIERVVVL